MKSKLRSILPVFLVVFILMISVNEAKAWRFFGRETTYSECQGDLGYKFKTRTWYLFGFEFSSQTEEIGCNDE